MKLEIYDENGVLVSNAGSGGGVDITLPEDSGLLRIDDGVLSVDPDYRLTVFDVASNVQRRSYIQPANPGEDTPDFFRIDASQFNYELMEIFIKARTDGSGLTDDLWIQFNDDDVDSEYVSYGIAHGAAGDTQAEDFGDHGFAGIWLPGVATGADSPEFNFATIRILIMNPIGTYSYRDVLWEAFTPSDEDTGALLRSSGGGYWKNTQGPTEIKVKLNGTHFAPGSFLKATSDVL